MYKCLSFFQHGVDGGDSGKEVEVEDGEEINTTSAATPDGGGEEIHAGNEILGCKEHERKKPPENEEDVKHTTYEL